MTSRDVTDAGAATTRIRTSRAVLLPVVLLALCMLPITAAVPWLAVLYVVPVLLAVGVYRVGVDVDPEAVTVHGVASGRRVHWTDIAGLRAGPSGDLRIVLTGGGAIRLPVARARHLPVIAAASGGRVDAPVQ